ncbi:MAG: VOC family protein [Chloroflexi bacterium]|nr:VOC family protein [Chloroflexota bacterium]
MAKKRQGDPWMPAADYGRSLPPFSVNLIVQDIARSVAFYRDVLGASVHYADPDFAALNVAELEFMLHADHTYDGHPWFASLTSGERRGLGAELRLHGVDPDQVEARARSVDAHVAVPAADKPHGWREVIVADPDGYHWAVGVQIEPHEVRWREEEQSAHG